MNVKHEAHPAYQHRSQRYIDACCGPLQDFQARLRQHLRHLDARGMRYRPLG